MKCERGSELQMKKMTEGCLAAVRLVQSRYSRVEVVGCIVMNYITWEYCTTC